MQYIFYENKLPKEAIDIRYKVFTLEQGFAEEVDLDDFDAKSIHIIVFDGNTPIATARMFEEHKGTFHIGRLAVLKDHRHKHIGSDILNLFEKKANNLGGHEIVIGSQIDKADFYTKNGYKSFGKTFIDAGYPHIMMRKDI